MKPSLLTILPFLALPATAQFGPPVQIIPGSTLGFYDRAEAVDLDGGNGPDLLFRHGQALVWSRNTDGAGNFAAADTVYVSPGDAILFATGDLDSDGDADIVIGDGTTGGVFWLSNDGAGGFGVPQIIQSLGPATPPRAVVCADLDGDGLPDVAVARAEAHLFINTGGTFGNALTIAVPGGMPTRLLAGDMDLDGATDLVAMDGDGGMWVLANDGGGTGWEAVQVMTTQADARLQLADLDGDGDLDLLATQWGLLQWGGNGSAPGSVQPFTDHDAGGSDHWGHAAHLGCGPEMALLHGQGLSGWLYWQFHDPATGEFAPPVDGGIVPNMPPIVPGFLTTADLNGDGRADILHASPGGALSWYVNNLPAEAPEIVLQPFDTLCVSGTPYPLDGHASPSGGTWSGTGVQDNVFTPFETGAFALTYTTPCPASASRSITVIEAPTITVVSGDPANACSLDPLVFSATPAGGVWSGMAGPDGSVARDCSVRPTAGPAVYTYTAPNGECIASSGVIDLSMECPTIDLGPDVTLCTNSDTLVVGLQGPWQGSASLTGCDHTVFTPPSIVTGYFVPDNHAPGDHLIIGEVAGAGYCLSTDTLVVTVVAQPDAGTNGSTLTCDNSAPFSLFPFLGGTPQGGGSWIYNGLPHPPVLNPAVDDSGVYTYVVAGQGPCPADTATVTVSVNTPPNAGSSMTITICSSANAFAMVSALAGNPALIGQWTGPAPSNLIMNGVFIPGITPPGLYTYTVNGDPPCASATSSLTVQVTNAPNAGNDSTVTACSNAAAFDLFDVLGGTPQPGGTWHYMSGGVPIDHAGIYDPASDQPGLYRYTVQGTYPCPAAVAFVNVTSTAGPDAGTNGSTLTCNNTTPFSLFPFLGGTPQGGGSWTYNGLPHPPVFNPAVDDSGVYTYVVAGQGPCQADTATVTVSVNTPPNAGSSMTITICSSANAFAMVDALAGNPALIGQWTGPAPSNLIMNGVFIPGITPPGLYTYTVNGDPPCANATSSLTVQVTPAPGPVFVLQTGDVLSASIEGDAYQWFDCANEPEMIPGANEQLFFPSDDGQYAVQVTIGACTVLSDCVPFIGTSIAGAMAATAITIFPNPGRDLFTVDFAGHGRDLRFAVLDLTGRTVVDLGRQAARFTMDLSHLASGTYLLQWTSEHEAGRLPVVVQR